MNIKFYIFLTLIFTLPLKALADAFVPEFSSMQNLQCDITETISQNGSTVSKYNYHRLFMLDDPYRKIYINKEPIDYVLTYNSDKIVFNLQSMTDDYFSNSQTTINRTSGEYSSNGEITYDNPDFSPKQTSATGICKIVN
jgi:hypothetical protein